MTAKAEVSLLWPEGEQTNTWPISQEVIRDLELNVIVRAMCSHSRYQRAITDVFYRLCLDDKTIRYRQSILHALEGRPGFVEKLWALLPLLEELSQHNFRHLGRGASLQEVLVRARELELLLVAVQQLQEAFAIVSPPFAAEGLNQLQMAIDQLAKDAQFEALAESLPELLSALRSNASLTIGVNLDHNLRPEAAVLLAVHQDHFTESSLLDWLLGKGGHSGQGVAPLHRPPVVGTGKSGPKRLDAKMVPLFQDLAKIMEKVAEPVARELKKFGQINGGFLTRLHGELVFYLESIGLLAKLRAAGLPMHFPTLLSMDDRKGKISAAFNLQLALRDLQSPNAMVVQNDISFDEAGRIAILTGPNQGGKTTYMQSVGLVQVLAQVGLPVPGSLAELSPVDAIYTHYPTEEKLALGTGRFGDEAQRLRSIFEKVTTNSLVLLNESLATTGMQEGLRVARDIMMFFRRVGVRAIFTTHLYELAEEVLAINESTPGTSKLYSLVASKPKGELRDEQRHSYRVEQGPPLGRSYAEHIAQQYGISEIQLEQLLADRDLLE